MPLSSPRLTAPSRLMVAGAVPFSPSLAIGSALHHHKCNIGRGSSNCSLTTGSQSLTLH